MSSNELYTDYNGQQVLTEYGMRELGCLDFQGNIKAMKTTLSDIDNTLTQENLRTILWNLKKYSSVTYIKRYLALLQLFEPEYVKYLNSRTYPILDTQINTLKAINDAIAGALDGIAAILDNAKYGYKTICDKQYFTEFFTGPRGYDTDFTDLGRIYYPEEKTIIPFTYIQLACEMSFPIYVTAYGTHSCPKAFESPYSMHYAPADVIFTYSEKNEKFKTGDIIPVTGIWNPFSYKSGCPNFLIKGNRFPEISIATEKFEEPAFVSDDGEYNSGDLRYTYEQYPSDWQLLWEDTRYADGKIPDYEKEYLDESVAIPDGSTGEVQ